MHKERTAIDHPKTETESGKVQDILENMKSLEDLEENDSLSENSEFITIVLLISNCFHMEFNCQI